MSQLNGDKARFQRLRKAGLLRRDRARAAYAEMKRRAAAGTELVNVIGELAGVLPLDGGRRPAIIPAPTSSPSDMVEGPALH